MSCPNQCGLIADGLARTHLADHLLNDCPLLQVPCRNTTCTQAVARRDLDRHVETCGETPVACENKAAGCAATPLRKDVVSHAGLCDYAMIPCEQRANGCRDSMLRRELAEHTLTCAFLKVPCGNAGCAKTFLRKDLAAHMERECDQRTLLCTQGCGAPMKACEARSHNCVASLRTALTASEAALASSQQQLQLTREAAQAQFQAVDDDVATLQARLAEQSDRLEALVCLLGRAVGDHHNLGRALNEPASILADARRKGKVCCQTRVYLSNLRVMRARCDVACEALSRCRPRRRRRCLFL